MAADDLIDFEIIETQKENIQSLPSGRSAKALAQLYTPPLSSGTASCPLPSQTQNLNNSIRQEYEKELLAIDDSDDPLDIYDRYVKWTLDAYPSAQNTPQSQLCSLLERATKAFQSSTHYKNDPRYLKLWLHYIRFFSDSPRETFAYLARHNIGDGLALFYEEFAAWLESAGRWTQAEEVYQMGIDREARPTERLIRKYGEFQHRFESRPRDSAEPLSPALPAVRPALAAKIDPFSHAHPSPTDPQAQTRTRASGPTSKPGKQKLAIFSDANEPPQPGSSGSSKGWESIGNLADRRKENTTEARPWAGETLKVGKKNTGVPKMMIFKDEVSLSTPVSPFSIFTVIGLICWPLRFFVFQTASISHNEQSNPHPLRDQQQSVNPKTGRLEVVFVDLAAVYPDLDDPLSVEFSFEELRAKHRGWMERNWASSQKAPKSTPADHKDDNVVSVEDPPNTCVVSQKAPRETVKTVTVPLKEANDENDENALPSQAEIDKAKMARKARREERANRTRKIKVMEVREIRGETQTSMSIPTSCGSKLLTVKVQTNLDSPTGPKIKRKKNGGEATMTLHTKEAMEDIYEIFNQPLKPAEEQSAESDSGVDTSDDDDDYTSAGESTGTGRISCQTSEFGDETTAADFTLKTTIDDEEADDTDVRSVSAWSDFTEIKPNDHKNNDVEDDTRQTYAETSDQDVQEAVEDLVTPTSPNAQKDTIPTRYVPIPPQHCEVPTRPYRDPIQAANNRLPFMTPIVEKTESSIGLATARSQKDYFAIKTPSRSNGTPAILEDDGEPWSSPFHDALEQAIDASGKIAQPSLVESQKPLKTNTDVKEPVPKGPIIKDAQCNPVDEAIREIILSQIQPPLSSYEGFSADLSRVFNKGAEVRKFTKAVSKMSKNVNEKTVTNLFVPPTLMFEASDRQYSVKRELGKGAFAPVYLVEGTITDQAERSVQMGQGEFGRRRQKLEAIKMEDPPSAWEFYIMRQAKRRLGVSRASDSIIHAFEMHLFKDEGFLVEEYRDQGTLLDLVNISRAEGSVMDEQIAMFFTIELFRTVESLHAKGLIHGDLKADNILVRFESLDGCWSSHYERDGRDGWAAKGISLIDFGRGIDMKVFKPDVQFIADWKTTEADCAEMRELRPWTYQIDYHGLAGIVHNLLFGKYIETVADRGATLGAGATKTYRIRESLKRYWQTDIWKEVFDLLLNPLMHLEPEDGQKLPVLRGMKAVRDRMETYLEENCEKGVGLKALIRRMEEAVKEKRRS